MSTLIDNTGTESLTTVAGLVWTKTVFPSYRNYRTERFVVTQSEKRFWNLFVANADGAFSKIREAFTSPESAMGHAATL